MKKAICLILMSLFLISCDNNTNSNETSNISGKLERGISKKYDGDLCYETMEWKCSYDKNGNLIDSITYLSDEENNEYMSSHRTIRYINNKVYSDENSNYYDNGKLKSFYYEEFNENDLLIQTMYLNYNKNGYVLEDSYNAFISYNSENEIINRVTYGYTYSKNTYIKNEVSYIYNGNQIIENIKEYSEYGYEQYPYCSITYSTYDDLNLLVEQKVYLYDNKFELYLANKKNFEYDENNKLSNELEVIYLQQSNYKENIKREYSYQVDGKNNVISKEVFKFNIYNQLEYQHLYLSTYDENNNLIEEVMYSIEDNNKILKSKNTFKFNSNNKLTESEINTYVKEGVITSYIKEFFEYDERNNNTLHKIVVSKTNIGDYTYSTYEYDENNNVINATYYAYKNKEESIIQTIEYFYHE